MSDGLINFLTFSLTELSAFHAKYTRLSLFERTFTSVNGLCLFEFRHLGFPITDLVSILLMNSALIRNVMSSGLPHHNRLGLDNTSCIHCASIVITIVLSFLNFFLVKWRLLSQSLKSLIELFVFCEWGQTTIEKEAN